ncbi:MAG: hypothetical protein GKS00_15010 [Alphaproteobacteria bacterium]|nr:hypothetical protein [Alphaproteobacteria bacterium]
MHPNSTEARAVLAVWTDAQADAEADFNEWYNRQHVNERCDVSGFLSGRRYGAIAGRPRYMALYDTTGADILSSKPYRAALDNPTPWTQRIMPSFHNMTRAVLDIHTRVGRGYGSVAASFRPRPGVALPSALADWLVSDAIPAVLDQPGITGAQLLESNQQRTATDTTEGRLRSEKDSTVEWALFVEGTEPKLVRSACRTVFPQPALQRHGTGPISRGLYRLLYGNDALRKDFA